MSKKSNTFCVYPWMHQMASPTGKVNFCCISHTTYITNDDNKPFDLSKDSFQSAWNSGYMKNIRQKMLTGEKVIGCDTCYNQEAIGKKSYRQQYNEEWTKKLGPSLEERISFSIKNGFAVNAPPVYLDLRLGNLCNLKCRMCNPHNSVMIEKEWNDLDTRSQGMYSSFWKKYGEHNGHILPWYESNNFWTSVETSIPHLQKVYLTGGEPTLIQGNYRFLRSCIDKGYANNIELFFNINFTNLSDEFLNLIKEFKWVSINASVDGYNEVNEYIRGNSRWNITDKNINKFLSAKLRNCSLGFSPVIQIYNILNITDLFNYIEQLVETYGLYTLVDLLFCYHPLFLSHSILPQPIKNRAVDTIEAWSQKSKLMQSSHNNSFFIKNGVASLLNSLKSSDFTEDNSKLNDFIYYTRTLDRQRQQSFEVVLPELAGALKNAGYSI